MSKKNEQIIEIEGLKGRLLPVKTEKRMTFHELIAHIKKTGEHGIYFNDYGFNFVVTTAGTFIFNDEKHYGGNEIYTVYAEKVFTKYDILGQAITLDKWGIMTIEEGTTITECIQEEFKLEGIYTVVDGKVQQIWERVYENN